jgi:tRNA nucleotidyltransferase/poly(A) polymerase
MSDVKEQYLDVYNKYGIVNDMLAIAKQNTELIKNQSFQERLLKEKDERIKDLNREITDLMEREKDWKRREEKWEEERDEIKMKIMKKDKKIEALLEQNTLLLKQLSLKNNKK